MSFYPRATRRTASRYEPRLESLESRRLFAVSAGTTFTGLGSIFPLALTVPQEFDLRLASAPPDLSTLSVVGTTPANGAILHKSPDSLEIQFNQLFHSYLMGTDVGLWRVDADGTVLEDLTSWVTEPFDLWDDRSTLPATLTHELQPGRYQIVILGSSSFLSGIEVDGNPGAPLSNSGYDEVVSTFTIAAPGPHVDPAERLADAADLGTVGAVPSVTPDSLDLAANSGNYHLYKFTLAPGHFWRLGAEVTAERDGGTLKAALVLFDAQGRVIKTGKIGRLGAPSDPYLFAGLEPGTYYLGVSAMPNLPGEHGGYNPVAGQFGTVGIPQEGGPYRLHVVADVADAPTRLLDSQLIVSDPWDPRPSGIDLVFSGPMDIRSFQSAMSPEGDVVFKGLEVVDDSGRVWPMTLVSYHENNSQYTFLFKTPLPKGRYTLRVPAQQGVTDLTGRAPVAPGNGQGANQDRAQTLATWTVENDHPPQSKNDLGTILSGIKAAATRTGTLRSGESVDYRFVVPIGSLLTLESLSTDPSFLIQIFRSDGTTPLKSVRGGGFRSDNLQLPAGVYTLRATATGSVPADFRLTFLNKAGQGDSILENGVGQGPALNLTLITPIPLVPTPPVVMPTIPAPTGSDSGVVAGPPPFGGNISPVPVAPSNVAPSPSAPGAAIASSEPTGLVLTLGGGLVGTPTAGAERVSAVGPATRSGGASLAANTTGVLQGINYGQGIAREPANLSDDTWLDPSSVPVRLDGLLPSGDRPLIVTVKRPASDPENREVASSSEWLGGIGTTLLNLFATSPPAQAPLDRETTSPEPIEPTVPARVELTSAQSEEDVEHADLAAPITLTVVSVIALRQQKSIRRWIKQRKSRNAAH